MVHSEWFYVVGLLYLGMALRFAYNRLK